MAKEIVKHYATVSQEGEDGPIRGKIPTGLGREMGVVSGSVIEFETQGKVIIGGRVLTQKEAARLRGAPAEDTIRKPRAVAKKVVAEKPVKKKKVAPAPVPAKKKPVASKRRTTVEYEEPAVPVKKKKKVSFAKKKRA